MSRVLVVSEDAAAAKQLESAEQPADFEVNQTDWEQWDIRSLAERAADVFLFDYRHPEKVPEGTAARLATELKRHDPQAPLVFVADFDPFLREMIQAAIGERNVTFADAASFASGSNIREVLKRLLARYEAGKTQSALQVNPGSPSRAFPHLTPEVRNPQSGRLDARRVSELFAIPLNRLASALGADAAAVYKTPDAPSLQAGLLLYERIARSLLSLIGSPEGLRIWLNTPEPELDNEVPRDLLLSGEGQVVAELLEDMQEGQPA